MKKIFKNIGLISGLFTLLFFNACKENIDPVVDELDFNRAFTPTNLSVEISNSTTVTLKWTSVKNTDHYVLEIYEGTGFDPGSLIQTNDIESSVTTFTCLLAGDAQFSARLKAISSIDGVAESKWTQIEFATEPENLFNNFVTEMTGLNTCIVRWKPGETVTGLVFDNGTSETPYTLTPEEITAGIKTLSAVPNAKYEIRLNYNSVVRGRTNLVMEGDALIFGGGDLNTAINALPAGGVLLLENGASFGLTKVDTVTTSIKIRGVISTNLPKIYLNTGGGNHMFDIDPAMTLSDSLVFENVDLGCTFDDAGVTKHRGVIDQEATALHIGLVKFKNCIIRNSERSAIRLRGNASGQVINNLEFVDCLLYDLAMNTTQSYGIVNPNAATASIVNIKFINTTVYYCKNGLINYGAGIGCQSVLVDNCTLDQMEMDATARWFIDFGTGTSAGTITVSDCIFGQTSTAANGIRPSAMTLSVTGSYFTSDFINVNNSITGLMTGYGGASTALWTNPATGVFTFLDNGFAGRLTSGDPRWRQ